MEYFLDYDFCPSCGNLKERGKICKACSKFIKSNERSERISKDMKFRQDLNQKKNILKERSQPKKIAKKKRFVRYSETGGLDYYYEVDSDVKRTKLNFCVKCRQSKLCYAGWWVKAGGKYASDETRKRIFICSDCWRPNKKDEN